MITVEEDLAEVVEEAIEATGEAEAVVAGMESQVLTRNAGTAGRKVILNIIVLTQRKKPTHQSIWALRTQSPNLTLKEMGYGPSNLIVIRIAQHQFLRGHGAYTAGSPH